jgi:hypothetical protein
MVLIEAPAALQIGLFRGIGRKAPEVFFTPENVILG